MLSYAIVAMIVIIVAAVLYMGYRADEAQRDYDALSPEAKAARIAMLKVRMRTEGKWAGEASSDDVYDVDFAPIAIAIVMVSLCAMAGLSFCTVFFTLCFAAICFQTADMIVTKMIIDIAEGNHSFNESATA
jgi:hypothetical protein